MIAADTNIIARYLIKDVEPQARSVKQLIDDGETLYINEVVLSELSWVLLKFYEYNKFEFVSMLDGLLETEGFVVFDYIIVRQALVDFVNSSADFVDCLIHQINLKQKLDTVTFDQKAGKLSNMRLLS